MARGEKIWLKRATIPLWVIQLICLCLFTAAAGLALYAVESARDHYDLGESVENALNTGAAIQLSFSLLTIIMVIMEIILSATHRLGPVFNIVLQCIKSAIWTVFFVLSIIGAAQGTYSGLSIFLILVLWLTCMGQLIYGSVILHRHRKGTLHRGTYALAGGGQGQHLDAAPTSSYSAQHSNPFQDPHATPSTYVSMPTHPAPYPHSAETAYKPQGAASDFYGGGAPNAYEMHGNPVRH